MTHTHEQMDKLKKRYLRTEMDGTATEEAEEKTNTALKSLAASCIDDIRNIGNLVTRMREQQKQAAATASSSGGGWWQQSQALNA